MTAAIMDAEEATLAAANKWKIVGVLEAELAANVDNDMERAVARRGRSSAFRKAEVLGDIDKFITQ